MPPLKNFLPPKGNPFGNPCEAFVFTRFVADYELRELAKILGVSVAWLLGLE